MAYFQMVFNMHNFAGGYIGWWCWRYQYVDHVCLLLLCITATGFNFSNRILFGFMFWTIFIGENLHFLQMKQKLKLQQQKLSHKHERERESIRHFNREIALAVKMQ